MHEWDFIIAAYAVTWAALCGYLLYVRGRERRTLAAWRHLDRESERRS